MAACSISVKRTLLVEAVSFPPFRTAQFPLLMHRQLICTSASGRASKMIPITPMGTVTLFRISPSSSCRCSVIRPVGFSSAIRLSMPARQSDSLCASNFSRFITAGAMPAFSARARSSRFAAKIFSLCSFSASAASRRASFRTPASAVRHKRADFDNSMAYDP